MELIYLFHNFSVNVLNESKSADGSWTTDIVHSIFFTNRKYLFQISRKKRNDPFYFLFTQLFYKCNFIFWTEDSCWINKKTPFFAFRVRCETYYIVLLYTVRSSQFPNVCRSPDLSSASVIVFPQFLQWHYDNWLPLTVAGPYRTYTGFPFHLAFDKNIHQISIFFSIMVHETTVNTIYKL